MAEKDQHPVDAGADAGRRKLLKAVAVAGGAAAAAAVLPGSWSKPVAGIGALPAHAQTSETPIRITSAWIVGTNLLAFDAPAQNRQISAACVYQDDLGEVDKNTYLETEVIVNGTVSGSRGASPCLQDKPIRDYPWHTFAYATPSGGTLYFNVVTPCAEGCSMQWRLHVGGRYSNTACAGWPC